MSLISPLLIGRSREFVALEEAITSLRRQPGQLFLIAGDTGVGKSRLVDEVAFRAGALGLQIIKGQGFEQDTAYPYSLWIDALHSYCATTSLESVRLAFGPFAHEASKLLPEVALTLAEPAGPAQLDPETERRRIFEGLAYFLTTLSRSQPLLLIVEDAHWSDKTSLDFLYFFVRRLTSLSPNSSISSPILLLITYRQYEYRQDEVSPALQHFLAQLDREHLAREFVLAPLSRSEVAQMLRTILGTTRPLPTHLVEEAYTYTEGNPFFIEEITKLWLSSGEINASDARLERKPQGELQIPRSVLAAVQQNTALLSPAARNMLSFAAVIGRRFDFTLLAALLELSETALVVLLKEAIASQLVVEESAEQLAFRHALMREAIYSGLLRRERRQLHQQVFTAMTRLYAAGDAATVNEATVMAASNKQQRHLGAFAYHAFEAGMWQQAFDYSWRAGQQAQSLYAAGEAIIHFSRALAAAGQSQELPTTALLRARGKAYEIAGDFEAAHADYEQTLALAQQQGPQQQDKGMAEWQALVDLGFLWAARDYARTGDYFQRALALARTLDQSTLVAHSLNRAGNWYANVEQPTLALRYHEEALAIFRAADDRRGLAETHDLMGMAHQLNSDLIDAYQDYQQAIALWQSLQDRTGLFSSLTCLTVCTAGYLKNVDLPAIPLQTAIEAAQEARQIAQEMNWRAGESFAALMVAMCLGPQGEYIAAFEAAQASLHAAEEIEHTQWVIGAHVALGTLYLDLLNVEAAHEHLAQALTLAQPVGSQVWIPASASYLASTYIAAGLLDEAGALLDEMLSPDTPMQLQGQRLSWFAKAELALAHGDAQAAQHISERLFATAAHFIPGTTIITIPRMALLLGRTLAAQGNYEQASAILLAALAQGELPQQWRIHVALGKLYQSQSRRTQAEEHYSAARALIEKIATKIPGGEMRQRFCERALAMLPAPSSPTPTQLAKQQAGGLTAREREIALLIAEGKSNQEIAATLFVGLRTVEAHITRILTKLDFTSRVQIAAWVVERKLSQ